MDDSVERIDMLSGVATSKDSNGVTMKLPRGYLTINTITLGDTIIPLVRSKGFSPRTNDLTRPAFAAAPK